jgi:hypothetical protein
MPDGKFNLTARELPPFLNGWCETAPRSLTDNFAGLAASRVEGQHKYLWLLLAGRPACQITGADEHVGTPKVWWINADCREYPNAGLDDAQSKVSFCPRCAPGAERTEATPLRRYPLRYPLSIFRKFMVDQKINFT